MLMANIPRRRIYETMLEFEEHYLEMQVLYRNQDTFEKFKDTYAESYTEIQKEYRKILSLIIIFFENRKYANEEEFEADIKYYIQNQKEVLEEIKKSKILSKEFKNIIETLENKFAKTKELPDINTGKDLLFHLDKFNSNIPLILEIRRDHMKNTLTK